MKVINENPTPAPTPKEPVKVNGNRNMGGYVYLGIMLVIFGSLLLIYNFDLLERPFIRVILSWQMVMVVIGGYLLSVRKLAAGFIVGGIGLCLLIMKLIGSEYITKVGIPVAIVLIGIVLIITKLRSK